MVHYPRDKVGKLVLPKGVTVKDEGPEDLDKVNKQRLAAASLDVETRNKAFSTEPKAKPAKETSPKKSKSKKKK